MPSYELCNPTISDYEFLKHVHHTCLKPFVEKIWGWDELIQNNFFDEDFKSDQIQIIRAFNQSAGYLHLNPQGDVLYLVNILILPEHQGQKLGTAIIQDLIDKTRSSGITLRLGVFKINTRAKALYESLHFQTHNETETHYLMELKPT